MADGMERRGPAGDEAPDEGGADGAERAFEALRAEVAELRGALVALVEQVPRPSPARAAQGAAPDYSPTLGVIAKELKAVGARLEVIEAHPALALTPGQHAQQVAAGMKTARDNAAEGMKWASTELAKASGELRGIVGSANDQLTQGRREWAMAALGAALGFMLWWPLLWGLPWGLGERVASTLVPGEGRWGAGQTLMHEADPEAWRRMARLYNACPRDASTEVCEAAMAVRSDGPGPSAQPAAGEGRPAPPAAAAVPSPSRGKAGAGR